MMDDLMRWWRSTLLLLRSRRDRACVAGQRTCGHCSAHARGNLRMGPVPQGPDAWAVAVERWAEGESLEDARARGRALRDETRERIADELHVQAFEELFGDAARLVVVR